MLSYTGCICLSPLAQHSQGVRAWLFSVQWLTGPCPELTQRSRVEILARCWPEPRLPPVPGYGTGLSLSLWAHGLLACRRGKSSFDGLAEEATVLQRWTERQTTKQRERKQQREVQPHWFESRLHHPLLIECNCKQLLSPTIKFNC